MMDPGKPLSTAEAAKILGVSPLVLAKWRSRRTSPPFYRFPSVNGLGTVRYLPRDLYKWIEENTVQPTRSIAAAAEEDDDDGYDYDD